MDGPIQTPGEVIAQAIQNALVEEGEYVYIRIGFKVLKLPICEADIIIKKLKD